MRKEYNEILGIMEKCLAVPKDSTTIYWCKKHKIPLFDNECKCCREEKGENGHVSEENSKNLIEYIGTDVRPVFPEEQLLLAIITDEDDPYKYTKQSVWYNGYCYLCDGEKVKITLIPLIHCH